MKDLSLSTYHRPTKNVRVHVHLRKDAGNDYFLDYYVPMVLWEEYKQTNDPMVITNWISQVCSLGSGVLYLSLV